jgi:hypothetical protein
MIAFVKDEGDMKKLAWKFAPLFPTTTDYQPGFRTTKGSVAVKLINSNQRAITCTVWARVPVELWYKPWTTDDDKASKSVQVRGGGGVQYVIFTTVDGESPLDWTVGFDVKGGEEIKVLILERQ